MEWVKLGDIAEITMGQSPDSSYYNENGEGLPFFQGVSDFGEVFPSPSKFTTKPKKIAQKGDILIGVRAPVGDINISNEDCCIGRGIASIRPNNKNYSRDFLYFHLLSQNKYLNSQATGSTFKAISRSVLENILVPKFTSGAQENITYTIASTRNLIAKRREQIDGLDALVSSVFYDMFQPYLEDKEKTIKLSDITSHISSGSTPRGGKEVYTSDGILFIRSQDVLMNRLDYSEVAYIPLEIHKTMKRSTLHYKDVLINITGASIGRTAVFYGETGSANTNQHVASIRLKGNVITPEFLSYYFSTEYFQKVIQKVSSGGTREALNYQQIGEFRIPEAPISKQEMFVRIKSRIEAQKESLRASLLELETLFDALMQEAFSGHLNQSY